MNVVKRIEPNITETTKKGNVLLQLGDFPEEASFRDVMSNLPRSVCDAKRKLEEKQELLEAAIEKNKAFDDVAEQIESWIAAAADEPVFAEAMKTTNPVVVEKRLQQLEVIVCTVDVPVGSVLCLPHTVNKIKVQTLFLHRIKEV